MITFWWPDLDPDSGIFTDTKSTNSTVQCEKITLIHCANTHVFPIGIQRFKLLSK